MNNTDLAELVKLHGNAIYGFCYRLAKNQADAEDLYQETFLKALELCYKIDKANNPKGFILSISAGIWKNNRRKYAWRQRIAPTETIDSDENKDYLLKGESSPETIFLSGELQSMVQAAADTLSDKLKVPVYMYYTAELSIEEIAGALKLPQGTVKSRLHKAKKAMKKVLEEENYEKF